MKLGGANRLSNRTIRNAAIGVPTAVVTLTALLSGSTWAQDASPASPSGKLVVAPLSVQREQTALEMGFHVEPAYLEVRIEHRERFTPEGEWRDDAGTPWMALGAIAPTWVALNATPARS